MIFTDISFTVFDTETTGLNPQNGDRIVEIAGVRIENGIINKEEVFDQLVNPECAISAGAQRVNQISNEDVKNAPTIVEVLPDFLDFAKGSMLIAHNAEFDISFLEAEKEACWGFIEIPECICTLRLSRALFPHEYSHNLGAVAKRFNLPPLSRHRALPDVMLTAQAFLKMIEKGQIGSLGELREKGMKKLARSK